MHLSPAPTLNSLNFRELNAAEMALIGQIDRSEEIFECYVLQDGKLSLKPCRESVAGFDPEELELIIERQLALKKNGGAVRAAFDGHKIAGVVSVERTPAGSKTGYCKMDILYVDKAYRKLGLGGELLRLGISAGKMFGAAKLYISATPTKGTVDFYLRHGAILTDPDPELYRAEPLDIHLELSTGK